MVHFLIAATVFAAFALAVGVPLAVWTARREAQERREMIRRRLEANRAARRSGR